ncbi:hypothetical protein MHY85_05710 [Cellulomonas sp. ACRRI]|uniref:hypothetical protein n=1 Tax=Cellulomonas sp. ACRRI TaxID=2918188 RepID=UPI001EF1897D|nr:hypothetical protein [Cellulomonas sp. ACRRI]MCG7285472.1 hypothetical protein [Cellulomonas sp. ACRRI]
MAAQVQANDELIAKQSSCLESAGYVFTVQGDGQFLAPEGTDVSAFASALRQCTADALGDLDGWRPGPGELGELHDRQLDVVACLEHEGYVVRDVPSRDAYVDSGGTWTPYDQLVIDGDAMVQLKRRCPDPGMDSL